MMEPLLERLLVDAEMRAARREPREALLLLRWAATISSRAMMPRVLLAFHRVRALHHMSDQHPGVPSAPAPVESDRLGFPVPRFASRPPELDRTAFVPAPRFTPGPQFEPHGGLSAVLHPRARRGSRSAVVVCLVMGTAVAGVLLQAYPAESGSRVATEAAAAALRMGNAREALAILGRIPDPDSHALMVRGRVLLALADTQAGVFSFQKAVEHPTATTNEIFVGARELARLPCCAATAADAYVLAFERGIPAHRFPEIAQHLDRAGRVDQARRVRELGGGSR